MNDAASQVSTASELLDALHAPGAGAIEVSGAIFGLPSFALRPGQRLFGASGASIRFAAGQDGIRLTADNAVEGLEITTDVDRVALGNDRDADGFGRLRLERLRTVGCVKLVATGPVLGGNVAVDDLHILEADTRDDPERPSGFGVEVTAGAFTLRNRQPSPDRLVGARIRGLAVGRIGAPVRGTGILIGGSPGGGEAVVSLLETGDVFSDGGIEPGTADRISGGVFIVQGARVARVRNVGAVTTYGANDMVLDNWGTVGEWHALEGITSFGPNGIGFVNLGQLGTLTLDAPLVTNGPGACGFNSGEVSQEPAEGSGVARPEGRRVPAGTVRVATFERIVTRGDGAVGVQVSAPAGRIVVRRGIETFGGVGESLARGVVTRLAAIAFSVKPGGAVRSLEVEGGLLTHGRGVCAMELLGPIERVAVSGSLGPTL